MTDWYDENELADSVYARILMTGDPKAGKTTVALTSSPGPIAVLNCDKPGAPQAAKRHGAKNLLVKDVESIALWKQGVTEAIKMAQEEKVKTIVVDTVTMLINNVIARECSRKYEGFEIWRETMNIGLNGINQLLVAPAHVILIAHYDYKDGKITLDGNLKETVPALVHDIVHLEKKKGRDPERLINIVGGRSSDETCSVPANMTTLLEELQIKP